jgi:peptidoglycan/xylan/chitin deacetylase (PgdA/CDA1 family)
MYHDVEPVAPRADGGPGRFTVSTASFDLMLDTISAAGMDACSLTRARSAGEGHPVAITFDDGTSGQFDHAVPSLRERGMTATFFVVTDWVGRPGFMTWEQLRQLKDWGMSVQSHTKSHPHLSTLDEVALRTELAESRRVLDERLDQETLEIALPGGNAPRPGLRHLLGECGYAIVANSRWGTNEHRADAPGTGPRTVRRCNVPRVLDADLASRIIHGDLRLKARKYPREAALNAVRALLGAERYARWRRRVLGSS